MINKNGKKISLNELITVISDVTKDNNKLFNEDFVTFIKELNDADNKLEYINNNIIKEDYTQLKGVQ